MQEQIISVITSNLLNIVLGIISIVISYYLIPAIKNQLVPWLKEKHLYDIVYKAVLAAEKLGETSQIRKADKKQYVLALLQKRNISITPEVEQFIETACEELDLIEKITVDTIKEGGQ